MYQVKTIIKGGKPVFEVRRYATNFRSSVLIGETDTYEKSQEALTMMQRLFPTIDTHFDDPNQLIIDVNTTTNGKK